MAKFFKTIEELKAHITLESDFKLSGIEPYLLQVESGKLLYELGVPFFEAIAARYGATNPSTELTDAEISCIALIQNSTAHLAAVLGMPSLMVSLSGSGLMQKTTGDRKGLYQWQKIEYENSHLDAGYSALDSLLELLWANRNDANFVTWKDSLAEKRSVALVINTAKDFNEYYAIGSSRRTFEALKSSINTAELMVLKPLLGDALFAEIKAQITGFNVSATNAKILPQIKGLVANSAIKRALGLLSFKLTADGLMVTTVTSTGSDSSKQLNTPTPDMVRENKALAQESVDSYVSDLLAYLHANIDSYPLFTQSAYYTNGNSTTNINSTHQKIVSL